MVQIYKNWEKRVILLFEVSHSNYTSYLNSEFLSEN